MGVAGGGAGVAGSSAVEGVDAPEADGGEGEADAEAEGAEKGPQVGISGEAGSKACARATMLLARATGAKEVVKNKAAAANPVVPPVLSPTSSSLLQSPKKKFLNEL